MFGHTIAVHLRAQLSHFELCMVSSKIDQRQCFKGSKGKGEVHIMTTIIPTISYFNLEGVCFSFASFFFHFNSIIGRFTFTIFFKSLPEIHQSRQKQDLFKKACPPPTPLSISLAIPPSLLLLNFLRAQKSEVQSQRVSKNIIRTVALQRAQSAGEIMICSR